MFVIEGIQIHIGQFFRIIFSPLHFDQKGLDVTILSILKANSRDMVNPCMDIDQSVSEYTT